MYLPEANTNWVWLEVFVVFVFVVDVVVVVAVFFQLPYNIALLLGTVGPRQAVSGVSRLNKSVNNLRWGRLSHFSIIVM